jgi:hypothetical protein
VSHAGGALLVETARRSGLAKQLSARLEPWRRPLATQTRARSCWTWRRGRAGRGRACDVAVLRAQPGVFEPVAWDPTVSRLIATLATDSDSDTAPSGPVVPSRSRRSGRTVATQGGGVGLDTLTPLHDVLDRHIVGGQQHNPRPLHQDPPAPTEPEAKSTGCTTSP